MRALVLAVALAAAPAAAVYQCGDTQDTCPCGANNPYPCCDNGGNCTWYAWHGACCALNVALPGWGNAKQWTGNARANASYAVQATPVVNSISCRDLGTYGHVAFVASLNSSSSITVKEQNCFGGYGVFTTNYNPTYFTGGFITRAGQVECSAGDSQQRSCGNCGTQARSCGGDGKWAGWSACGSEGECAPDAVDESACGDCGLARRTCTAACRWGARTACEASPAAAADAGTCATGAMGACSAGVRRCEAGVFTCAQATAAAPETCDGVDNDCDGLVDGPAVCAVAVGSPPSESGPPAGDAEGPSRLAMTSLGCSASPGAGATAALAWLALCRLQSTRARARARDR